MQVTLTPHTEELLRLVLVEHPEQSAAQIIEQALAERVEREAGASSIRRKLTRADFRAWVDEFASYSDKIPPMPGENFSREMIYQDHD